MEGSGSGWWIDDLQLEAPSLLSDSDLSLNDKIIDNDPINPH